MPIGGGTGGGGKRLFQPAESPFADIAARDAWAAANLDLLHNTTTMQTVVQVTGDDALYEWGGDDTPSSYDPDGWLVLSGLTASQLNLLNGWTVEGGRNVSLRDLQAPIGTVYIGESTGLSGVIRALHVRSGITGNTALLLAQLYDEADGFARAFSYANLDDPASTTVDLNDPAGTDNSDTAVFDFTTTADEMLFKVDIPTTRISETIPFAVVARLTSQSGPIALNFSGEVTTNGSGVGTIDFRITEGTSPILVDSGTTLYFNVECQGMVGDQVDVSTFVPNATVHRIRLERKDLALTDDTDHPVTLRRDMPSEVDAEALADASLNGNSALWIISTDQLSNSNRTDATIYALSEDQLDADGNEIPTTPTAANTIRLAGGTIVRVFAANDFRVVVSSEQSLNATSQEEVHDLIGSSLTAGTGIDITVDDPGDTVTITNTVEARTDEEIRDVIGTALVGASPIMVTVDDPNNTITISLGGGGTNPPTDADRIYYGLSDSNNPATVDVATLTREDSPTNPDTISTGVTTAGQYFILLVPQADDIVSIFDTVLTQDVTSLFDEADDVRTIDLISFKSYVLGPLNAGVNETYVINFGS